MVSIFESGAVQLSTVAKITVPFIPRTSGEGQNKYDSYFSNDTKTFARYLLRGFSTDQPV